MVEKNIILLPSAAEKLKTDMQQLMNEKLYEEALDILQLLLNNNYRSASVYWNTLICMKELSYFTEAKDLCEELLEDSTQENYHVFLEYYLMLLMEMGSYIELIQMIDKALHYLPDEYKDKLHIFKLQAEHMVEEESVSLFKKLESHILDRNHRQAYKVLLKWKLDNLPVSEQFYPLLTDQTVHPVLKTEILLLLKRKQVSDEITVMKYGRSKLISPAKLDSIEKHEAYLAVKEHLYDVEQHNPSLYMIALELLDCYVFVHYPYFYGQRKADVVADKLCLLASETLDPTNGLHYDGLSKEVLQSQRDYYDITAD